MYYIEHKVSYVVTLVKEWWKLSNLNQLYNQNNILVKTGWKLSSLNQLYNQNNILVKQGENYRI